jgi:hypothetical protein
MKSPEDEVEAILAKADHYGGMITSLKEGQRSTLANVIAASIEARDRALLAPDAEVWRCFHCGEVFTERSCAIEHFGASETAEPACQMDIAKYREMEELHARNLAEDTERDRVIYRLQAELTPKTREAEEQGYARGLRDARQELLAPDEATMSEAIISGCTAMRDPETGRCRYPDCQCDVDVIVRAAFAQHYKVKLP